MKELKNVEGKYFSTYGFVSGNNLEDIAEQVLGKDWEAEDDVSQIEAIIEYIDIGKYSVTCSWYDTREEDIIVTKIDDSILDNQEIKTQLEYILAKINDNKISAWNSDLENTTEAVAIEDHFGDPYLKMVKPSIAYNRWLDDLTMLISKL